MAHSDILSQPDRGLGLDRPQTEALLALFSRCDDLREFGREVIQSVVVSATVKTTNFAIAL